MEVLERVQRRAVVMVTNLRGRSYEDRLEEAGMTSLIDRRIRGDMIATYKIMTGKDNVEPGGDLWVAWGWTRAKNKADSRGASHHCIVQAVKPKLDIRKHSFSQRLVTTWNALPDSLKGVEKVLGFSMGYDEWVGGGRVGA